MWLILRSGPDAGAAVEVTAGDAYVLGRQQGCDVIVRDTRASRRHAEVTGLPDGRVALRDLDSANGTIVDGRGVNEAVLEGGEEILIGDVLIAVTHTAPTSTASPAPVHQDTPTFVGRTAEVPGLGAPTHSAVRRMVDAGTRRANRLAIGAAGVAVLALVVLGAVLLLRDGASVPEIVSRLSPSTVLVETEGGGQTGTGSGWVLDAERGLIVTNAHVVNQGEVLRVAADGRSQDAEVVGVAPCEDLAVLRVREPQGLKAAPLADDGSVETGETVVALGFGAEATAADPVGSTAGVVSVARTSFRDPAPDVPRYRVVIQTDTALNPGNSGGPLVDLDGKVVGINSAARNTGSDGRPLQNVNYAIAIEHARGVLDDLRTSTSRAWTGLRFGYPDEDELRRAKEPPGLRITGVVPGTPAAEAELEPGDLVAGVNGRPIGPTLASFCETMTGLRTGDEAVLDIAVPGRAVTRQVRLRLA